MSQGWLCVKGIATPEIANHPDRLRRPRRRKGERGGGEWESISWDDALGEITSHILRSPRGRMDGVGKRDGLSICGRQHGHAPTGDQPGRRVQDGRVDPGRNVPEAGPAWQRRVFGGSSAIPVGTSGHKP